MVHARAMRALGLVALPPITVAVAMALVLGTPWPTAVVTGALTAFVLCDMWYFLRLAAVFVREWLDERTPGRRRKSIFAVSSIPGQVLLVDIDRNAHCNNARFLRECGFGRRDLWHLNGVWEILKRHGGNLVVGAQTVRYRRELSLGQRYMLETRVVCWDDRAFYVEHRFVTTGDGDSKRPFVNAIVLVKNNVLGPLGPAKLLEKLPEPEARELVSPSIPEDIAKWIESNAASSRALRNEATTARGGPSIGAPGTRGRDND